MYAFCFCRWTRGHVAAVIRDVCGQQKGDLAAGYIALAGGQVGPLKWFTLLPGAASGVGRCRLSDVRARAETIDWFKATAADRRATWMFGIGPAAPRCIEQPVGPHTRPSSYKNKLLVTCMSSLPANYAQWTEWALFCYARNRTARTLSDS